MNVIETKLRKLADPENALFMAKTAPNLPAECILGCRTPELRALARTLWKEYPEEVQVFLHTLPHKLFDENQLHAFLISEIRDYRECLAEVKRFLPYVDNWATCDQLLPKVFRKEAPRLLPEIDSWIAAEHPYMVRFGVGLLMQHFLGERFLPEYPEKVADIRRDEYYIQMECAWYFATALAKQPEVILPYFTEPGMLKPDVRKKAVRKAIESRRIPDATKTVLRTLDFSYK